VKMTLSSRSIDPTLRSINEKILSILPVTELTKCEACS